jgi:RNA polymerase sigma factor (sigma-70 family)
MSKEVRNQYEGFDEQIEHLLLEYTDYNSKERKMLFNKIISDVSRIIKETRIDKEDVWGESKYILIKTLEEFNGHAPNDELIYMYLNYLGKVFYNRLRSRIDFMLTTEENHENNYTINLSAFENPSHTFNDLVEETFEDHVLDTILMEEFLDELSNREYQVYKFLILEGHTQESTANKLGIAQKNVFVYKERMLKKFKNYVYKNE